MKRTVLCFSIFLLLSACARQKDQLPVAIGQLEWLADCDSAFQLEDLLSQTASFRFTSADSLSNDLSCDTYWVRLRFDEGTINKEVVFPIRHVDLIEAYDPSRSTTAPIDVTGENFIMDDRQVAFGELPVILIQIPSSGEIYLRLTSTSFYSKSFRDFRNIQAYLAQPFLKRTEKARYFHGIFFGVMVAMIILNLFIYVMYRDKMYLVYTVFMVTQTLYHLSITGFLREFVLPNLPIVAKQTPFIIAGVSLLSYIWFSQVYLESKRFAAKLNGVMNLLYVVIVLIVTMGLFRFLGLANNLLLLSGILVVTIPFVVAIKGYQQHYRPAYFYLIASLFSYVGYTLFTLRGLDLIPTVFLTRYSFQISFAAQSLLFALGLGDRMNTIRKELSINKIKQAELKTAQEKELKEILERQNIELEHKVEERTSELVEKSKIIEEDKKIIEKERQKSDSLLRNILPDSIAKRLKGGEPMIADQFEEVSVFFCDIVGFTALTKKLQPNDLVNLLNNLFSEIDLLTERYGLEKIKTIGDSYMCVSGLPVPNKAHATLMASFASDMIHRIMQLNKESLQHVSIRIGIHCGPVVAGVIGTRKIAYDIWGETVNIASRVESVGEPMTICVSEEFKTRLGNDFVFRELGEIELKGIGQRKIYRLET